MAAGAVAAGASAIGGAAVAGLVRAAAAVAAGRSAILVAGTRVLAVVAGAVAAITAAVGRTRASVFALLATVVSAGGRAVGDAVACFSTGANSVAAARRAVVRAVGYVFARVTVRVAAGSAVRGAAVEIFAGLTGAVAANRAALDRAGNRRLAVVAVAVSAVVAAILVTAPVVFAVLARAVTAARGAVVVAVESVLARFAGSVTAGRRAVLRAVVRVLTRLATVVAAFLRRIPAARAGTGQRRVRRSRRSAVRAQIVDRHVRFEIGAARRRRKDDVDVAVAALGNARAIHVTLEMTVFDYDARNDAIPSRVAVGVREGEGSFGVAVRADLTEVVVAAAYAKTRRRAGSFGAAAGIAVRNAERDARVIELIVRARSSGAQDSRHRDRAGRSRVNGLAIVARDGSRFGGAEHVRNDASRIVA